MMYSPERSHDETKPNDQEREGRIQGVNEMLKRMDEEKIAKAQRAMGMKEWVRLREKFEEDADGLAAEIEKYQK